MTHTMKPEMKANTRHMNNSGHISLKVISNFLKIYLETIDSAEFQDNFRNSLVEIFIMYGQTCRL